MFSETTAKQVFFLSTIARFVFDAKTQLYISFTAGEFWRPPEMCEIYAKDGRGIRNSNHPKRLAADLCAFDANGKFLTTREEQAALGALWKSYSTEKYKCVWGGDFLDAKGRPKPDANHYSIEDGGVK